MVGVVFVIVARCSLHFVLVVKIIIVLVVIIIIIIIMFRNCDIPSWRSFDMLPSYKFISSLWCVCVWGGGELHVCAHVRSLKTLGRL